MAKHKRTGPKKAHSRSTQPLTRQGLPTREEVLDFIEGSREKVGKREIARAFGVKGGDRIALKTLLAEMTAEGEIVGNRKSLQQKGRIPPVTVLEVVDRDSEGEIVAVPVTWEADDGPRPRVMVVSRQGPREEPDLPLSPGDRILARVTRLEVRDAFTHLGEQPARKVVDTVAA